MKVQTLKDLFIHSLSDVYSAEKQLLKALPKMARASTNEKLKSIFEVHLQETSGQVGRIDQLIESCGIKLLRIKCAAMEGLVEEGKELIDEVEKGAVLDAGLIGAAQKVEHYEIATYGTLVALARKLGEKAAMKLLLETLEEEKNVDRKLTALADEEVTEEAAVAK